MKLNKILVIALLGLTLLTGCGPKTLDQESGETWVALYDKFNVEAQKSDDPARLLDVLKEGTETLAPDQMTRLVYHYEQLLLAKHHVYKNLLYYRGNHKRLYDAFPVTYKASAIKRIDDPEFRALMLSFSSAGYSLEREGNLYKPVIDYHIFDQFVPFMDEEGQDYIAIRQLMDLHDDYSSEKNLLLTGQASKILVKMDRFFNKYPNSRWNVYMGDEANNRMLAFVLGVGDNYPYDDHGYLRIEYRVAYEYLAENAEGQPLRNLFAQVLPILDDRDDYMMDEAFDFIAAYPEMYRKVYLEISGQPHAKVDVAYGQEMDYLFYYPQVTGLSNPWEEKQINQKLRDVAEASLFAGMFDKYGSRRNDYWSDFNILYNRDNLVSLYLVKYQYYDDGGYRKSIEPFTYDFKKHKRVQLGDVLADGQSRETLNNLVYSYLNQLRQAYTVDYEAFKRDLDPKFLLSEAGIFIFLPLQEDEISGSDYLQVFISHEKLDTKVTRSYEIYQLQ